MPPFTQASKPASERSPQDRASAWHTMSNVQIDPHSKPWQAVSSSNNVYQDPFHWSNGQSRIPGATIANIGGVAEPLSNTIAASDVPARTISGFTPLSIQAQSQNTSTASGSVGDRYSNLGFVQRPSFATEVLPQAGVLRASQTTTVFENDYDDPNDPWDIELDEEGLTAIERQSTKADGLSDLNSISVVSNLVDGKLSQSEALIAKRHLSTASPLFDERSQKVFKHFISVTGPCMGTFDRHDSLGSAGTILKMIWTYGLPAMAFQCPPLAHAILAVSAMHMSKLNLGSENVAVKHFTYALRRVGAILGDPKQRLQVSTLAIVLLLGYYEVMAGDHSRWNLHLSGAGKLVMEHNYAGAMRTVMRTRARAKSSVTQPWMQTRASSKEEHFHAATIPSNLLDDNEWKVDQTLISNLMGHDVNYDTQVQPNFQTNPDTPDFDQRSLDDWRILVELYWWYCRQDVFMSMLSGDQLLLPYSQWIYCPPRGPLDNAVNAHTTLDHLWLVLARVADFGGKDRKRKQRVVNMQGGQWIPAPGFLDRGSMSQSSRKSQQAANESHRSARPSANEGRARTSKQGPGQSSTQPPFYGMIPPVNSDVKMPTSFKLMNAELQSGHSTSPVDVDPAEGQDLETQTRRALDEHASITKAFDLFESCLGSDYQPLPSSDVQITTPFGPALQYKTPTIATMWTFLLAGRILLRRMHPYSPPAAMVSVGVNAHVTHDLSQTIGRICGGLFAQHNYLLQAGHVDTVLSAAVMETTFSLLFAAVQFHDPIQRGWTISKLSEIAQVTGWQTSAAVAGACESMWEKAGMAGKGPPYHRTMDRNNADARLNGKHRYRQIPPVTATTMSPAEEHESRFVSHDRNLIDKHASTRAHWALGLLSVDEDLQRITINENERA